MLLMLLACISDLSATCSNDRGCAAGSCVNSICQGAPCTADAECATGQECASIQGTNTCARPCEVTEDCFGESTCQSVPADTTADAELVDYCF